MKKRIILMFMLICSCLGFSVPLYAASWRSAGIYEQYGSSGFHITNLGTASSKNYYKVTYISSSVYKSSSASSYDYVFKSSSPSIHYTPYDSNANLKFTFVGEHTGKTFTYYKVGSGFISVSGSKIYTDHCSGTGYMDTYEPYRLYIEGDSTYTVQCTFDIVYQNSAYVAKFGCNCPNDNKHDFHRLYIDGKLITNNLTDNFVIKNISLGTHSYKIECGFENPYMGELYTKTGNVTVKGNVSVTSHAYSEENRLCKFNFTSNVSYDKLVVIANNKQYTTSRNYLTIPLKDNTLFVGKRNTIKYYIVASNGEKSDVKEYTFNIPSYSRLASEPTFKWSVSNDYKQVILTIKHEKLSDEFVSSFKCNNVKVVNGSVLKFPFEENKEYTANWEIVNTAGTINGVSKFTSGYYPETVIDFLTYYDGALSYKVSNSFGKTITLVLDGTSTVLSDEVGAYNVGDLPVGVHTATLTCNGKTKTITFKVIGGNTGGFGGGSVNIIVDSLLDFLNTLRVYGVYILLAIIIFALVFLGAWWLYTLFRKWLGLPVREKEKNNNKASKHYSLSSRHHAYKKGRQYRKDAKRALKASKDKRPIEYEKLVSKTDNGYVSNYGIVYKSKDEFDEYGKYRDNYLEADFKRKRDGCMVEGQYSKNKNYYQRKNYHKRRR